MRRLGQKHYLELDEHAQLAQPACDEMPLTWHVTHGLHRVSTTSPGPIEMYEPPAPRKPAIGMAICLISALVLTSTLAAVGWDWVPSLLTSITK